LAEASILMPGEVAGRAGRLPVHLIDDLLQIAADERRQKLGEAAVEPDRIQHGLVVGWPLDHRHRGPSVLGRRYPVEEIAMPEAAAMGDTLCMQRVDRGADRADLIGAEHAAHDREPFASIMSDIIVRRLLAPRGRLVESHVRPSPTQEIVEA
jgi:hypothetical protein